MRNSPMRNIIAGTAGHIDHGKTALVKALTGIDTDRLEEEKRRGISIDLGFAHLDLPGGIRIGFVDVPGHERFVRNMLAGAAGIDLVLLVVAATESIRPQTREHFDICRLLGVERGIIVLTKADLVEPDILDLVRLEAEELVRGSFLEDAPVVATSAVTGQGLDELRGHLGRMAVEVRGKDSSRYFRLPIDRAFSMRGFGTVVTGTLVSGAVAVEQEVELHPSGKRVRVRGLQVHGSAVERALAGQRTAANLAGVEVAEIARGMVLADAGRFRPATAVDTRFHLLPSAKPLKNRAPVHFHAGTAEIEAEARLLGRSEALAPGAAAWVRFLLREPLLILPGDRFIVRMFSPVVTIGGGTVLDAQPPRRLRPEQVDERLRILAGGGAAERIEVWLGDAPCGMSLSELVARSGLTEAEIESAVGQRLELLPPPQCWVLPRQWFARTLERLKAALAEFHRQNPLLPGIPREELRARELSEAPAFLLDALLARTSELAADGDTLRLASHKLRFSEDEQDALHKIEEAFRRADLAVPGWKEVLARCGVEASRARALLQHLLRDRRLIRVSEDLLYHAGAIERLRSLLAARRGERFGVGQFKDWTGVSRKYAIPLLEFLDRERVTRRDGDSRVVL